MGLSFSNVIPKERYFFLFHLQVLYVLTGTRVHWCVCVLSVFSIYHLLLLTWKKILMHIFREGVFFLRGQLTLKMYLQIWCKSIRQFHIWPNLLVSTLLLPSFPQILPLTELLRSWIETEDIPTEGARLSKHAMAPPFTLWTFKKRCDSQMCVSILWLWHWKISGKPTQILHVEKYGMRERKSSQG